MPTIKLKLLKIVKYIEYLFEDIALTLMFYHPWHKQGNYICKVIVLCLGLTCFESLLLYFILFYIITF
jgi:hypothetical protein